MLHSNDKSYPYMGVIASSFPYFFTAYVYPLCFTGSFLLTLYCTRRQTFNQPLLGKEEHNTYRDNGDNSSCG